MQPTVREQTAEDIGIDSNASIDEQILAATRQLHGSFGSIMSSINNITTAVSLQNNRSAAVVILLMLDIM